MLLLLVFLVHLVVLPALASLASMVQVRQPNSSIYSTTQMIPWFNTVPQVIEVPEMILKCVSRDEATLAVVQKVFKSLYENALNSIHIVSHLAILAAIRDVCKLIVKELTSWGSDVPNEACSPLTNKLSPKTNLQPTMLYNSKNYLSPKAMPPLKFYSGFLGPHSGVGVGSEDDDENVASVPDDIDASYSGEEGSESSDSDMFHKPITQNCDEEVFGAKSCINYGYKHLSYVIRDALKENLRIEVPIYVRRHTGGHLDSRGYVENHSVSRSEHGTKEHASIAGAHVRDDVLSL